MGILLKLKNANLDISVIIGDFKNLSSIFSVKIARLISFTTLARIFTRYPYVLHGEQFDTRTVGLDLRRTKLVDLSVFLEEKDRALNRCSP